MNDAAVLDLIADMRHRLDALERAIKGEDTTTADLYDTQPSFASPGEWIATPVAMRLLRVSSSTLYRWARRGKILGEQGPEGTWRFHKPSVDALRARHVAAEKERRRLWDDLGQ